MGTPWVNSYRGIEAGDTAVLRSGGRVPIKEIQIQTFEGVSFGIEAILTPNGSQIHPRDIARYEKPDGRPIPY